MELQLQAGRIVDPCFRYFYYQDSADSFHVGVLWHNQAGVPIYGKHAAETVIERLIRPMLSEVLCRKADGSFTDAEGFEIDDRYVMLNPLTELVVCNL